MCEAVNVPTKSGGEFTRISWFAPSERPDVVRELMGGDDAPASAFDL